jgi:hypothetical protein
MCAGGCRTPSATKPQRVPCHGNPHPPRTHIHPLDSQHLEYPYKAAQWPRVRHLVHTACLKCSLMSSLHTPGKSIMDMSVCSNLTGPLKYIPSRFVNTKTLPAGYSFAEFSFFLQIVQIDVESHGAHLQIGELRSSRAHGLVRLLDSLPDSAWAHIPTSQSHAGIRRLAICDSDLPREAINAVRKQAEANAHFVPFKGGLERSDAKIDHVEYVCQRRNPY